MRQAPAVGPDVGLVADWRRAGRNRPAAADTTAATASRDAAGTVDRDAAACLAAVCGQAAKAADEVRQLCGPSAEEVEQLDEPGKRTLLYRSRQLVPQRSRSWGWIGTVDHWQMEHQEVDIAVADGVVSDVQARVRHTRLAHPDALAD